MTDIVQLKKYLAEHAYGDFDREVNVAKDTPDDMRQIISEFSNQTWQKEHRLQCVVVHSTLKDVLGEKDQRVRAFRATLLSDKSFSDTLKAKVFSEACRSSDLQPRLKKVVMDILDLRLDANWEDRLKKKNLLHIAARHGNKEACDRIIRRSRYWFMHVLDWILRRPAPILLKVTASGENVLHRAGKGGHRDLFVSLHKKTGLKVSGDEHSPIWAVRSSGNNEFYNELVRDHPCTFDPTSDESLPIIEKTFADPSASKAILSLVRGGVDPLREVSGKSILYTVASRNSAVATKMVPHLTRGFSKSKLDEIFIALQTTANICKFMEAALKKADLKPEERLYYAIRYQLPCDFCTEFPVYFDCLVRNSKLLSERKYLTHLVDEIIRNQSLLKSEVKDIASNYDKPQRVIGELFQQLVLIKDKTRLLALREALKGHQEGYVKFGEPGQLIQGRAGESFEYFLLEQVDKEMAEFLVEKEMIADNKYFLFVCLLHDLPLPNRTFRSEDFLRSLSGSHIPNKSKLNVINELMKDGYKKWLFSNIYIDLAFLIKENRCQLLKDFIAKFALSVGYSVLIAAIDKDFSEEEFKYLLDRASLQDFDRVGLAFSTMGTKYAKFFTGYGSNPSGSSRSAPPPRKKTQAQAITFFIQVIEEAVKEKLITTHPTDLINALKKDKSIENAKKLYRKVALALHPDKHPGEEQRYKEAFQKLSNAYQDISVSN